MRRKNCFWLMLAHMGLAAAMWAGTLGKVVPIGGHAADLALDEARGVIYLANFTANQIDVISLGSLTRRPSMAVASQPSSLAMSPNGRYLLVTHFANYAPPNTAFNGMTVIRLDTGTHQTITLPAPPFGVAFTSDNVALIVTSTEFLRYNPATGTLAVLTTLKDLTATTLPVPPATFPPEITRASVAASADGEHIFGLTDTLDFRFDRYPQAVSVVHYTSEPDQGPRVVSVNRDGTYYTSGWCLLDRRGRLMAQFPGPVGLLNVGSHAIDSQRGLVYAQVPSKEGEAPVLMVADADNLNVRERFDLPENLAGKSVLSSDGNTMYSISDSGLMVLPVGSWERQRRLTVTAEDVFFQSSFCDRRAQTKEIYLVDGAGGQLDFAINGAAPGLSVSPSSGTTPATVRLQIDPAALANRQGTVVFNLEILSAQAVNQSLKVRVLVNLRQPDQRGTVVNVPGKLVDLLADPARNRFYILRQDRNQVLVYDGGDYHLLATLRTGNTPTQMAFTYDRRYLMVGNTNSQIANVFDLETLQASDPIFFPGGHYPRSLAAAGRTILGATRVAGPKNKIDRVDFNSRTAWELATLGVWENDIHINTVLTSSPGGATIMAAEANGNLLLYDANADAFTISRKDSEALEGAYAASSYDFYVVDNLLLNSSLVPEGSFDKNGGKTSGFALSDLTGFLTTVPSDSPGLIQRFDFTLGSSGPLTRLAEAPLAGVAGDMLTRTLAVLANRSAVVALTTSGFSVLAWDFDAATAPPSISRVVNAADFTAQVAPGSLMALFGSRLSPVNVATSEMPLPRALGESCLLANGAPVPMLFVSSGQINAQLPYEVSGNVTLILHTPGGVSDSYRLVVSPTAPSVFRSGSAGPLTGLPTIVRVANYQLVTAANPVHRGDTLVIYLTGMGGTSPTVESGEAAPAEPLAYAQAEPVVTLGGWELPVSYAGLTPGLVGVYQINARVPDDAPTGMSVSLTISQGGYQTTLPVRVIQ